jgi:hypothetical protein
MISAKTILGILFTRAGLKLYIRRTFGMRGSYFHHIRLGSLTAYDHMGMGRESVFLLSAQS